MEGGDKGERESQGKAGGEYRQGKRERREVSEIGKKTTEGRDVKETGEGKEGKETSEGKRGKRDKQGERWKRESRVKKQQRELRKKRGS